MIDAVVFDIDGTLLDHHGAERKAMRFIKEREGVDDVSFRQFMYRWRQISIVHLDMHLDGSMTFQEQKMERMKDLMSCSGVELSEKEAKQLYDDFTTEFEKQIKLYEDVHDCLASLKGFKLGIISNGEANEQRRKLQLTGIDRSFSSVIISNDIGLLKPDRRIFDASLRELQVNPERALYVGDKIDTDIIGARNAGMVAVLIDRHERLKHEGHQGFPIIHSLKELKTVMMQEK